MAKSHPRQELTFLLIKPDGVVRGLVGEVIRRVEQRGLKVVALEMEHAAKEKIDTHYPKDPAWIRRLGEKTLASYEKFGFDPIEELGTKDTDKIGKMVRNWLVDFLTQAPIVKMVIKGVHSVEMVRKIAGETMPANAPMGTIRGDYSVDSAALANKEKRAVHNLVHASETAQEAEHEIEHWFGDKVIHDYKRSDELMF